MQLTAKIYLRQLNDGIKGLLFPRRPKLGKLNEVQTCEIQNGERIKRSRTDEKKKKGNQTLIKSTSRAQPAPRRTGAKGTI